MANIKALEGRKDLLWILRTTFTVKKTIEVTKRKEYKTFNKLPKIYTNRLDIYKYIESKYPFLWDIVIKIVNQTF
jgi:hypothetical protein